MSNTISFSIEKKTDRFSVGTIDVFEQEEDDPGFIRYHLTPIQARQIIVGLWNMLGSEEQPRVFLSV